MSLQPRYIQLSIVGITLLCLLAMLYLLAGKRISKRDPSTIIKHPVDTSPDDALKYWTADKMRKAKPAKMPHVKALKQKKQHPQRPPNTSDPQHS